VGIASIKEIMISSAAPSVSLGYLPVKTMHTASMEGMQYMNQEPGWNNGELATAMSTSFFGAHKASGSPTYSSQNSDSSQNSERSLKL